MSNRVQTTRSDPNDTTPLGNTGNEASTPPPTGTGVTAKKVIKILWAAAVMFVLIRHGVKYGENIWSTIGSTDWAVSAAVILPFVIAILDFAAVLDHLIEHVNHVVSYLQTAMVGGYHEFCQTLKSAQINMKIQREKHLGTHRDWPYMV